ncbi:hypothetical protein ACOMHN_066613 [Nucella lapillus]
MTAVMICIDVRKPCYPNVQTRGSDPMAFPAHDGRTVMEIQGTQGGTLTAWTERVANIHPVLCHHTSMTDLQMCLTTGIRTAAQYRAFTEV